METLLSSLTTTYKVRMMKVPDEVKQQLWQEFSHQDPQEERSSQQCQGELWTRRKRAASVRQEESCLRRSWRSQPGDSSQHQVKNQRTTHPRDSSQPGQGSPDS